MTNSTKVIIINSDSEHLSVIDTITNFKHRQTRPSFDYVSFSSRREKKTFNIFECSECLSDSFLSEKNLVILTFNEMTANDDQLKESLFRRLVNVLTKNIIPSKILLLGLVQTSVESSTLITKIQKYIDDALYSYIAFLQSKIFLRNGENLPFQSQKLIANQINLLEQLQTIQNIMTIACLDVNSKKSLLKYGESSLENEYAEEIKAIEEATKILEEGRLAISQVTKADVTETKSFAYPPKPVIQVAECACIIFGMKTSYEYFKRFMSQTDLLMTLINYDPDSMSDYAFRELKKYIDNPDFTPEICMKYSKFASHLCKWIRSIYHWNTVQKRIEPIRDKIMNNVTKKSTVDVIYTLFLLFLLIIKKLFLN